MAGGKPKLPMGRLTSGEDDDWTPAELFLSGFLLLRHRGTLPLGGVIIVLYIVKRMNRVVTR